MAKLLLMIISIIILFTFLTLHYVREDHIGVYWRGGQPLEWFTDPGYHFMLPGTYYSSIPSKHLKEQIELYHVTRIQLLIVMEKIKIMEQEHNLNISTKIKNID